MRIHSTPFLSTAICVAAATPLWAQDAKPANVAVEVEVCEKTELRGKGGAQVDETHWRLSTLETREAERTTRHVIKAETRWVRDGVEKSKSSSIAEGRRVVLAKNEFGALAATWTNGKPADLGGFFVVGCRADPARWGKALKEEAGKVPISRFLPALLEFHLDRLQNLGDGEGSWRIEKDPRKGEVRFFAEWKPVARGKGELSRSLRIVVKTAASKKPLPAKPKLPPVRCAPCDGAGELECKVCRGAAKPCANHGALRMVDCPDCEGRGLR